MFQKVPNKLHKSHSEGSPRRRTVETLRNSTVSGSLVSEGKVTDFERTGKEDEASVKEMSPPKNETGKV